MKIVIIGCGWLGQLLAKDLLKAGHDVWGSYRSEETKKQLSLIGVKAFEYHLSLNFSQISNDIVENTAVLIFSVPPLRSDDPVSYAILLQNALLSFNSDVRVIFMSSTGVYPNLETRFKENYSFTAKELLHPVLLAEKHLSTIHEGDFVALRLGGLIGPGRHPIVNLSGREMQDDGKAIVNLIHSDDISRLVQLLLNCPIKEKVYNVSFPLQQYKCDYYRKIANKLGLPEPYYSKNPAINREVDSSMISTDLGFKLLRNVSDYVIDDLNS